MTDEALHIKIKGDQVKRTMVVCQVLGFESPTHLVRFLISNANVFAQILGKEIPD